ncbi:MAG TPA: hypothetical protein VGC95_13380 [Chitinophagaceae bacterium]
MSIATDASILRNFPTNQRFWSFGQDVVADWHRDNRSGPYAWLSYYSNGHFKNPLVAVAKSPLLSPQQINFVNRATVRLVQISLGWKRYFVGTSDADGKWNVYGLAGFGLIFGKAANQYTPAIDTSNYSVSGAPVTGTGHFKRLTVDLGLGWEVPLGGDIFLYIEGKTWIPASNYPSPYLFDNKNAPFTAMTCAGIRILF